MVAEQGTKNRALPERNAQQIFARRVHGFLHGERHLPGFAIAEADLSLAVADHRQGGEAELAAALDDFRDAIDADQFLQQAVG